jgi:hypothetical protein
MLWMIPLSVVGRHLWVTGIEPFSSSDHPRYMLTKHCHRKHYTVGMFLTHDLFFNVGCYKIQH